MHSNTAIEKYIFPSGLLVSHRPHVLNTVLGSCVAVCLWDEKLHIGGMNHYMLPLWNGVGLASPKYGNIAIEKLVAGMNRLGSRNANLKAKVFGGASMLMEQSAVFNIGLANVNLAWEMLEQNKIQVLASSTGGNRGRKILFNTSTGEVLQKYLNNVSMIRTSSAKR